MFEIIVFSWFVIGIVYYFQFVHKLSRSRFFDFIGTTILLPFILVDDLILFLSENNPKLAFQRISMFLLYFL